MGISIQQAEVARLVLAEARQAQVDRRLVEELLLARRQGDVLEGQAAVEVVQGALARAHPVPHHAAGGRAFVVVGQAAAEAVEDARVDLHLRLIVGKLLRRDPRHHLLPIPVATRAEGHELILEFRVDRRGAVGEVAMQRHAMLRVPAALQLSDRALQKRAMVTIQCGVFFVTLGLAKDLI
jgi:hypothetical protein